jgi:hypothetical protein
VCNGLIGLSIETSVGSCDHRNGTSGPIRRRITS